MSLVLQPLLPFPDSCQGMSPHQQGRGTKMTEHCYGGIDVSKDRLDVMVLPDRKSFSVDNNAAGYSELVKRLRGLSIAAIGIEPSGGYERAVIRALLAADLSVRRNFTAPY
jgi:transposase